MERNIEEDGRYSRGRLKDMDRNFVENADGGISRIDGQRHDRQGLGNLQHFREGEVQHKENGTAQSRNGGRESSWADLMDDVAKQFSGANSGNYAVGLAEPQAPFFRPNDGADDAPGIVNTKTLGNSGDLRTLQNPSPERRRSVDSSQMRIMPNSSLLRGLNQPEIELSSALDDSADGGQQGLSRFNDQQITPPRNIGNGVGLGHVSGEWTSGIHQKARSGQLNQQFTAQIHQKQSSDQLNQLFRTLNSGERPPKNTEDHRAPFEGFQNVQKLPMQEQMSLARQKHAQLQLQLQQEMKKLIPEGSMDQQADDLSGKMTAQTGLLGKNYAMPGEDRQRDQQMQHMQQRMHPPMQPLKQHGSEILSQHGGQFRGHQQSQQHAQQHGQEQALQQGRKEGQQQGQQQAQKQSQKQAQKQTQKQAQKQIQKQAQKQTQQQARQQSNQQLIGLDPSPPIWGGQRTQQPATRDLQKEIQPKLPQQRMQQHFPQPTHGHESYMGGMNQIFGQSQTGLVHTAPAFQAQQLTHLPQFRGGHGPVEVQSRKGETARTHTLRQSPQGSYEAAYCNPTDGERNSPAYSRSPLVLARADRVAEVQSSSEKVRSSPLATTTGNREINIQKYSVPRTSNQEQLLQHQRRMEQSFQSLRKNSVDDIASIQRYATSSRFNGNPQGAFHGSQEQAALMQEKLVGSFTQAPSTKKGLVSSAPGLAERHASGSQYSANTLEPSSLAFERINVEMGEFMQRQITDMKSQQSARGTGLRAEKLEKQKALKCADSNANFEQNYGNSIASKNLEKGKNSTINSSRVNDDKNRLPLGPELAWLQGSPHERRGVSPVQDLGANVANVAALSAKIASSVTMPLKSHLPSTAFDVQNVPSLTLNTSPGKKDKTVEKKANIEAARPRTDLPRGQSSRTSNAVMSSKLDKRRGKAAVMTRAEVELRERSIIEKMGDRLVRLHELPLELPEEVRRRAVIEMKKIRLVQLQRRVRKSARSILADAVAPLKRSTQRLIPLFRREIEEPQFGSQQYRNRNLKQIHRQKREIDERQKHERKRMLNSLIEHANSFRDFHQSNALLRRKVCRDTEKYHAQKERERERQRKKLEMDRVKALKENDEEQYMKLLQETKSDRVMQLLKQTDEYMKQLGAQVERQKKAALDSDDEQFITEHVAKVVEEEKEDSSTNTFASLRRRRDAYYSVTHTIKEEVKQPSILVGGTLKHYQIEGLAWMVSLFNNHLNGILADEMGLGKTIQTISLIAYLMEQKNVQGPFLIIVPLSTLGNWVRELDLWLPSASKVIYRGDGQRRKAMQQKYLKSGDFNVLLSTYEFVVRDKNVLGKLKWRHVIIDEGHRMKNVDCKLSQMLTKHYKSKNRLLLTGTPLQNNLTELWGLLNFILPEVFQTAENFEHWFNAPFQAQNLSVAAEGTTGLSEEETLLIINRLHQVLRPFLLRRLKSEVESQLPEKVETVVRCPQSGWQKVLYAQLQNRAAVSLGDGAGSKQFNNMIMQLKKICNHPFLFYDEEQMFSIPNSFLVRSSGKFEFLFQLLPKLRRTKHKCLIFSQMTTVLDYLGYLLEYMGVMYLRLDGRTKADDRPALLELFNSPESQHSVFILSTRAGGLGLNLQSADTVVIFDSDWNPQMDLQAQDRVWRIGQKNEVRVFRLVTAGTVEEQILEQANRKLRMDAQIIQAGKFDNKSSEAERRELLKNLIRDHRKDDLNKEEEGIPTAEMLNKMISRGEAEFELFEQMDKEREELESSLSPNQCNKLLTEKDVPDWVFAVNEPVEKREAPELGRGRRKRKDVCYADNLTELEVETLFETGGDINDANLKKERKLRARRSSKTRSTGDSDEEADTDNDLEEIGDQGASQVNDSVDCGSDKDYVNAKPRKSGEDDGNQSSKLIANLRQSEQQKIPPKSDGEAEEDKMRSELTKSAVKKSSRFNVSTATENNGAVEEVSKSAETTPHSVIAAAPTNDLSESATGKNVVAKIQGKKLAPVSGDAMQGGSEEVKSRIKAKDIEDEVEDGGEIVRKKKRSRANVHAIAQNDEKNLSSPVVDEKQSRIGKKDEKTVSLNKKNTSEARGHMKPREASKSLEGAKGRKGTTLGVQTSQKDMIELRNSKEGRRATNSAVSNGKEKAAEEDPAQKEELHLREDSAKQEGIAKEEHEFSTENLSEEIGSKTVATPSRRSRVQVKIKFAGDQHGRIAELDAPLSPFQEKKKASAKAEEAGALYENTAIGSVHSSDRAAVEDSPVKSPKGKRRIKRGERIGGQDGLLSLLKGSQRSGENEPEYLDPASGLSDEGRNEVQNNTEVTVEAVGRAGDQKEKTRDGSDGTFPLPVGSVSGKPLDHWTENLEEDLVEEEEIGRGLAKAGGIIAVDREEYSVEASLKAGEKHSNEQSGAKKFKKSKKKKKKERNSDFDLVSDRANIKALDSATPSAWNGSELVGTAGADPGKISRKASKEDRKRRRDTHVKDEDKLFKGVSPGAAANDDVSVEKSGIQQESSSNGAAPSDERAGEKGRADGKEKDRSGKERDKLKERTKEKERERDALDLQRPGIVREKGLPVSDDETLQSKKKRKKQKKEKERRLRKYEIDDDFIGLNVGDGSLSPRRKISSKDKRGSNGLKENTEYDSFSDDMGFGLPSVVTGIGRSLGGPRHQENDGRKKSE